MIKKVEHLLRSYKENKAEVEMLTYRLDLNAVDYSKDKIQTSNISSLDEVVIAREKKLIQLKQDIHTTEALNIDYKELDIKEDKKEMVNHPSHYNMGKYEAIDVIEDWNLGFNLGNTVKYISRAGHKDNILQDLKKALWYLDREIKRIEKE